MKIVIWGDVVENRDFVNHDSHMSMWSHMDKIFNGDMLMKIVIL